MKNKKIALPIYLFVILWGIAMLTPFTKSKYVDNLEKEITINTRYPIYTIIFNKNSDDVTGEMNSIEVKYNKEEMLPQNTYEREGYIFGGWNTNEDGTGTKYEDKETVKNLSSKEKDEINIYAIWEKIHKVIYDEKFENLITGNKIETINNNENLELNVNITDINEVSISMGNRILTYGEDYTYENGLLTVYNVISDISLNIIETVVKDGFSISTEWIDNHNIEITLNGTNNQDFYIRIYKGDVYIATKAQDLYIKEYADNPMFDKENNVYITYTPISGTANLKSSFTIKLRNVKKNCAALSTAELIANTPNKSNFTIDAIGTNEGILTEAASYISVYSTAGNTYNNLKFRVSFGAK